MTSKQLMVIALALLASACGERASPPASPFKSTDISSVEWGRDFHLTDHNGRPASLADFEGKVVLLFFGFANCPDVCVQGLFVTVDPRRDTPQALAKYVTAFHPTFLGLHADMDTTAALAREFKIFFAAQPADALGDYMVSHSNAIYVYDPQRRLRLLMGTDRTVGEMVGDIALLLKQ